MSSNPNMLRARRRAGSWQVLIPVKDAEHAKSRLAPALGEHRARAAMAFALDTVAAALQCAAVAEVTVATNDPSVTLAVSALGAGVIRDGTASGLNHAIVHALAALPHASRTAVLLGDLPALTSNELGHALKAAGRHATAFVADASGDGTTLLTAVHPMQLVPRFGPASAAAHAAAGVERIAGRRISRVRRDVDELADLIEATDLGVGRHTCEWLKSIDLSAFELQQLAPESMTMRLIAMEYTTSR